jgi:hypothetical protein
MAALKFIKTSSHEWNQISGLTSQPGEEAMVVRKDGENSFGSQLLW